MITKLLPEILAYIMILTQGSPLSAAHEDDNPDPYSNNTPASQPFEITISHVNSLLRDVALYTTHLWSFIHIDTSTQCAHLILERTKIYIHRSGGHCLDLRIELDGANFSHEEQLMMQQALELAAGESWRWRRLTVISEREGIKGIDALISKLSQGKGEQTPSNLEYLSISTDYASNSGNEVEKARFQKIALQCLPNLSFLRLRGLALYTLQLISLPTLQVLHLDQTKTIPMTSEFFERLTVACPALEHLSVYGDIIKSPVPKGSAVENVGSRNPFARRRDTYALHGTRAGNVGNSGGSASSLGAKSSQGIISLPQLQSLRVCGAQGFVYKILLSQLEAPKLRNLLLKDAHEHDLDALWEAPLAQTRSQTIPRLSAAHTPTSALRFIQIQSLIISNSNLSKSVYQGLLRVFPSITEFASYSSMDPHTASKFLDSGMRDVAWPGLRTLTFIFDVDLTADDKTMSEMLQKRKRAGYPVHKVRIGVTELGADYVQAEGLVAQGTTIAVERLENFDVWPSDRPYPDIDDVLF